MLFSIAKLSRSPWKKIPLQKPPSSLSTDITAVQDDGSPQAPTGWLSRNTKTKEPPGAEFRALCAHWRRHRVALCEHGYGDLLADLGRVRWLNDIPHAICHHF